ncbi:hypothetical protein GCM10027613_02870 [Microlunatus endophyticus]
MGPAPRSKSTKPTEATDASSRNGKKSATAAATRKHSAGHPASFVVVANRLPVDRVTNPDGSSDWRSSPAGW